MVLPPPIVQLSVADTDLPIFYPPSTIATVAECGSAADALGDTIIACEIELSKAHRLMDDSISLEGLTRGPRSHSFTEFSSTAEPSQIPPQASTWEFRRSMTTPTGTFKFNLKQGNPKHNSKKGISEIST